MAEQGNNDVRSKLINKVKNGQTREIVFNVAKFMIAEAVADRCLIDAKKVNERVSAATGVSLRTVSRIRSESRRIEEAGIANYNKNEESKESLPKKKKTRFTKRILQTDNVEVMNGANDGKQNVSNETSVFIKQEALELDEMVEGTPKETDPLEPVYLNSNIDQHNNEDLTKIKVEPLDDPGEENIYPESIKAEPLDIIDEHTVTSEKCPECDEEVWDLEHHIDEQHSKTEGTKLLTTKPKQFTSKTRKYSQPPSQTVSSTMLTEPLTTSMTNVTSTTSSSSTSTVVKVDPLFASTSQSSTLEKEENLVSKQSIVVVPKTAINKQPVFLPVNRHSSTVVPSPPPPPTPTTSLRSCTVDSSETFSISLAQFPESQRIAIKKKMLEVVEAVERLKINPEMIVIAHKAQIS